MSQGLAATRHLFGGHCVAGSRVAAELTRAEADLRTTAARLARKPDHRGLQNELLTRRASRDNARERAAEHTAECQACADRQGATS